MTPFLTRMVYCRAVTRTEPAPNFLVRWTLQALIAALLSVVAVEGAVSLMSLLEYLPTLWSDVSAAAGVAATLGMAALAALITGTILYRWFPGAAGEGIPAYLRAVETDDYVLPLGETLLKFPAAILTLGAFGSGGLVGPVGRVSAGLSQQIARGLQRWLPRLFADRDIQQQHYHAPTTAAVSGMAAAVTAIFAAPIAASIFAVEVVQKDQLRYHQLFPAALAAATTLLVQQSLGWSAPGALVLPSARADPGIMVPVTLMALGVGGVGLLYTGLYRRIAGRMRHNRQRVSTPHLVAGMLGAATISLAVHPGLAGTSRELLQSILMGTADLSTPDTLAGILSGLGLPAVALLALSFAKLLGNCLTTGSGMSAGFTGPALFVGASLGAAVALVLGAEAGSPTYLVLAVSGMAAMLASVINTPLAAAVLTAELFGVGYAPAATVASMLAFQVARSRTIYEVALDERVRSQVST